MIVMIIKIQVFQTFEVLNSFVLFLRKRTPPKNYISIRYFGWTLSVTRFLIYSKNCLSFDKVKYFKIPTFAKTYNSWIQELDIISISPSFWTDINHYRYEDYSQDLTAVWWSSSKLAVHFMHFWSAHPLTCLRLVLFTKTFQNELFPQHKLIS